MSGFDLVYLLLDWSIQQRTELGDQKGLALAYSTFIEALAIDRLKIARHISPCLTIVLLQ